MPTIIRKGDASTAQSGRPPGERGAYILNFFARSSSDFRRACRLYFISLL